jgi:hypothetical protein
MIDNKKEFVFFITYLSKIYLCVKFTKIKWVYLKSTIPSLLGGVIYNV